MDPEGINRSLGRIEGKQDLLLSHLDRLSRDQEVIKERVDRVEKRQFYLAGAFAAIGAGLMYFKDKVMETFT